jgi:hypothetical protein
MLEFSLRWHDTLHPTLDFILQRVLVKAEKKASDSEPDFVPFYMVNTTFSTAL